MSFKEIKGKTSVLSVDVYPFQCLSFLPVDLCFHLVSFIFSLRTLTSTSFIFPSLFSISYSAGLLEDSSFNFCQSEMSSFHPHFKRIFLLDITFFSYSFLSFFILTLFCDLLASLVSNENTVVIGVIVPLYLFCHFVLVALKVSLHLRFSAV